MAYYSEKHHQLVIAEKDKQIQALVIERDQANERERYFATQAERWALRYKKLDEHYTTLEVMLQLAATDYWREQMDGFLSSTPTEHIIESIIAQWYTRAGKGGTT